jgi:hypothetical protein
VIGGAEAALSAVDGQCVKTGLAILDMENGPDRRDGLFCRHPKGVPQELAPLVGKLGKTMFVDPYDGYSVFVSASSPAVFVWYNKNAGWGGWCGRASLVVGRARAFVIGKLMENKSRSVWELLCGRAERSQHTVSMSITNRGDA